MIDDLQFKDQVDQIDHEMQQDEHRQMLIVNPLAWWQKPRVVDDEDELMEFERECEND